MPELLLELLSEEIPAGMQARAAEDLARLVKEALAPVKVDDNNTKGFYGPRRIALVAEVDAALPAQRIRERGPRVGAPEAAVHGFLRKHGATTAEPQPEGGYWVLERTAPAVATGTLIAAALPGILRRFPWPKSMRWGASSFTWVRPLRRILCVLDGAIVPFSLAEGEDDGYGLVSGNLTEGHRFHAPGAFPVTSRGEWEAGLRDRKVVANVGERRLRVYKGLAEIAAKRGLAIKADSTEQILGEHDRLIEEVAGFVEWPVVLMGKIDESFMDLPPEVMRVTMRVNQRYFSFFNQDGSFSRHFAFVANIEAADGGAAIIAGNERVLRARLADARHFWDLDRRTGLEARVPKLEHVTFHARLGSQGARVRRIVDLVRAIAPAVGAPPALAERAAVLAKADLVSGMVGEFPELQGVMGSYYAENDGEPESVARAIREHYAPKGPDDDVPTEAVSIAMALADKLDLLCGFFSIGEKPSGSADPFGLRRAALGIIRIVRENALRINLVPLIERWCAFVLLERGEERTVRPDAAALEKLAEDVLAFVVERQRIVLRAEGARHDVLAAVFAAGDEDDLLRMLRRAEALGDALASVQGPPLLVAYRRAANILRIEARKDGPFHDRPDPALFRQPEEKALAEELWGVQREVDALLAKEWFGPALRRLAGLRRPLDAFFERVTVNAPEPELRRNRLYLLDNVRRMIDRVADLSQIEGREEEERA
ncbi:MAG: glycine--tRNA ligase subunit beta [Rhodospirillales bacterium]|nr:glycine--tRNA ligase subunit beta [Rhodospirillales bacterium]